MPPGIDRGARNSTRSRRQFQRSAEGDGTVYGNGIDFDEANSEINLDIASSGGLGFSSGSLTIDLRDTNPGLELVASGLGVLLNGTTLTLAAGGLSVSAPEGVWTVTSIKTGAYTANWGELVRVDASGGSFTITLPTAVGNSGRKIMIKEVADSSETVTIDGNASETIDGSATAELTTPRGAFNFISDGANVMVA